MQLSELRSDVSRDARHEVQFVARQSAESRLAAKKAALEAELEGMSEEDEEEIQKKKAMLKVEDDGPCELVVVVKADVDGTSEAVQAALKRLVRVNAVRLFHQPGVLTRDRRSIRPSLIKVDPLRQPVQATLCRQPNQSPPLSLTAEIKPVWLMCKSDTLPSEPCGLSWV